MRAGRRGGVNGRDGDGRCAPAPTQARSAAFYEYFECLTGVAVFLATNTYLILKVKRFGGVVRFAKRLWRAKSAEERAKVVASVLGYVSGTGALVKACAS